MDEEQQETPETPEPVEAAAPEVPALPEVKEESPEEILAAQPSVEEIIAAAEPAEKILEGEPEVASIDAPVEDVLAGQPSVEEVIAEADASDPLPTEEPLGAAPAPPTEPVADAIEHAKEAQAGETPSEPVAAPAPEAPAAEAAPAAEGEAAAAPAEGGEQGGEGKKKRSRRRKGSKAAEQWGVSPTRARGIAQNVDLQAGPSGAANLPKPQRGRSRDPLPFEQLRAAAESIVKVEGSRKALRDAFTELAPRERNDISALVSKDEDFRSRARSISAGSLAARKIGKALAAQTVAIAAVEDMWAVTLSKEEADQRQSRIRQAKNRDAERAKRNAERNNRADRVSREDLAKAQDGRVGAQVRFVIAGEEKRDRKKGKKQDQPAKKTTANDLLDKLGY